jgi:hypothetical protein
LVLPFFINTKHRDFRDENLTQKNKKKESDEEEEEIKKKEKDLID